MPPPKHFDPSTLRVTLVCNGVSMVLLREEHGLYESVARSEASRQPLAYLSIELPCLDRKVSDPESYEDFLADLHPPALSRLTGGLPFVQVTARPNPNPNPIPDLKPNPNPNANLKPQPNPDPNPDP